MPQSLAALNDSRLITEKRSDLVIIAALTLTILFFLGAGFVFHSNIETLRQNSALVARTHDSIKALDGLFAQLRDAETSQRGYLLTGNESYLEPYNVAVPGIHQQLKRLHELYADNAVRLDYLKTIESLAKLKVEELSNTIVLRRNRGFEAAQKEVATNRGKTSMDGLRGLIGEIQLEDTLMRKERIEEVESAYQSALTSGILTAILGVALALIVAGLVRRASNAARRQAWIQVGEAELTKTMIGDPELHILGGLVLRYFAEYFGAHVGAFYVREGDGFIRVSAYGLPSDGAVVERFRMGDGLLGQAAKDNRVFTVNDVPEGYITVGSALGSSAPRYLLIAPATTDNTVIAVLELGFLNPIPPLAHELLQRVAQSIGSSVRSAEYRKNLHNLLEETQRQAEELQSQSEELRVNNEELEEQSRVLKESQMRLEQQQAELEQTNAQLEEQSQTLEKQRDDLEFSQIAVEQKAQELERASQYKSDFLANMSHELRTPLNSSLILAKLLGDNPKGNLTDEQVKFARTIESSGNDLLLLINDILDLSKIEAGHMEIFPEALHLRRLVEELAAGIEPVANQKKLELVVTVAKGSPKTIETDRLRLEQVLKNLLSNAVKFTAKGTIELHAENGDEGTIRLSVKDTGIGIAEEQQAAIFEAFRQADGTISRKYGGTGLGLSISRELVKLLGGHIEVSSVSGKGSTFTVVLPTVYTPYEANAEIAPVLPMTSAVRGAVGAAHESPSAAKVAKKPAKASRPVRRISDDREALTGDSRIILIVEDDESFSDILLGLAHELGLHCIIANTAEEGLAAAKQYAPHAILLDIGLPDNSGLSVLDRLKRDVRTRHIPVHVVSGTDYSETAYSLGAVGYMLKPVKRTELIEAFKGLESRFDKRLRRVLIVEDDPVQQESVRKLLGSRDVETIGVATAAECLKLLKKETFDCMVLDLSLPDASGYSLLESLSKGDAYSFPPVIVYTGRELTGDEEQRLRKYSKSIIIKGAKSPERLLDEVTLFLHQMVAELPLEKQKMLETARNRDAVLEGRSILVVEDDIRNIYALTSVLEPHGVNVKIARNGMEALDALALAQTDKTEKIDLVLMDVMMPEMDGMTATREIRKKKEWKKLPIIMLTAKAMKDDQERCIDAGANDYMAKPLDVEKLLSLVRVWMPR